MTNHARTTNAMTISEITTRDVTVRETLTSDVMMSNSTVRVIRYAAWPSVLERVVPICVRGTPRLTLRPYDDLTCCE